MKSGVFTTETGGFFKNTPVFIGALFSAAKQNIFVYLISSLEFRHTSFELSVHEISWAPLWNVPTTKRRFHLRFDLLYAFYPAQHSNSFV